MRANPHRLGHWLHDWLEPCHGFMLLAFDAVPFPAWPPAALGQPVSIPLRTGALLMVVRRATRFVDERGILKHMFYVADRM